jgi:hypothetical protein
VIRTKVPVRTTAMSHAAAAEHMTALTNKSERVKAFSQDSNTPHATVCGPDQ